MPLFLYPFLNTTSKTRPFEYLRLTSLGVIGALVKVCCFQNLIRFTESGFLLQNGNRDDVADQNPDAIIEHVQPVTGRLSHSLLCDFAVCLNPNDIPAFG